MKIVGLISGGKDSIYNLIMCQLYGHEITCLANLYPPKISQTDELNSHMFQTVGHEIIQAMADSMSLPLIRQELSGKSIVTNLHYESCQLGNCPSLTKTSPINDPQNIFSHENVTETDYDEIDDLYTLLKSIKERYPEVQGVSAGSILSNYQRIRVERICSQLSLICYSYLWQRDQIDVLYEMTEANSLINPVLIKLATYNMSPQEYLTLSLSHCKSKLLELFREYGMNVCGEGGEYESLTLDCSLQHSKIVVNNWDIMDSTKMDHKGDQLTHLTVPYAVIKDFILVKKTEEDKKTMLDNFNAKKPHIDLNCIETCCCNDDPIINSLNVPENSSTHFELPPLSAQLQSNIDFINQQYFSSSPSQITSQTSIPSISRCFLRSDSLSDLFSAVLEFQSKVRQTYHYFPRPIFVMICIPDMKDFLTMNKQYSTIFPAIRPPSRVCVQHNLPYFTIDIVYLTTEIDLSPQALRNIQQIDENNAKPHALCNNQDVQKMMQTVTSQHVQGISTWAPANIGPYSQYWRTNGIFIGAGQIGLFPPTMQLYTCSQKQFLQTIKNTIACFQSACDIHQYNNNLQIAFNNTHNQYQNNKDGVCVPSLGQFTSLLLAFDQTKVNQVIKSIVHTKSTFNIPNLSKLQYTEIFLSLINTLSTITNKPYLSPNTIFDPITHPTITNLSQNHNMQPFGLLFNPNREKSMKISSSCSSSSNATEITALYNYIKALRSNTVSDVNQPHYFPPFVTILDTDVTLYSNPLAVSEFAQTNADFDHDDYEIDDSEAYQKVNNYTAMIFVPAAVLPCKAVFELCAVGLTNHTFKRLSIRSDTGSRQYGRSLQHIRWFHPLFGTSGQVQQIFITFGIFIANDYIDYTIFSLSPRINSPSTENTSIIPQDILDTIHTISNCTPNTSLNYIQSQLFTSTSLSTLGTLQLPTPTTNIFPTVPEFDELNTNVAKIYADVYSRLFSQKKKQFDSISIYMNENNDASPHNDEDFFFPRPTNVNNISCMCKALIRQDQISSRPPNCSNCSTCLISQILIESDDFIVQNVYHAVIGSLHDAIEDHNE